MNNFFQSLLAINHPDELFRQRGRNTVVIALGLAALNVLLSITLIFIDFSLTWMFATIASALIYVGIIALARNGRVHLASWLTVSVSLSGSIIASFIFPDRPVAMFLTIALVLAAAVLRFRDLAIVFLIVAVVLGSLFSVRGGVELALPMSAFIPSVAMLCVFLSLAAVIISFGNESLSRRLQAALNQAQHTAQQLQELNAELDRRVETQTAALQDVVSELEARAAEQNRLLAEVIAQRDVIRQLSAPVLPVSQDALVLPLVGAIDQERLVTLQQQALAAVEQRRARWLILDVTGVPVIDTQAAAGVIQLAQSVRLLGAEVALVGVRPEVAQTMVSLGIELPIARVYSDLASAVTQISALRSATPDGGNGTAYSK